jgi:hypothetical protein
VVWQPGCASTLRGTRGGTQPHTTPRPVPPPRSPQVLSYLSDVRASTLTGEDAGSFKLEFAFRANPFFTNEVRSARGGGA